MCWDWCSTYFFPLPAPQIEKIHLAEPESVSMFVLCLFAHLEWIRVNQFSCLHFWAWLRFPSVSGGRKRRDDRSMWADEALFFQPQIQTSIRINNGKLNHCAQNNGLSIRSTWWLFFVVVQHDITVFSWWCFFSGITVTMLMQVV